MYDLLKRVGLCVVVGPHIFIALNVDSGKLDVDATTRNSIPIVIHYNYFIYI